MKNEVLLVYKISTFYGVPELGTEAGIVCHSVRT